MVGTMETLTPGRMVQKVMLSCECYFMTVGNKMVGLRTKYCVSKSSVSSKHLLEDPKSDLQGDS